MVQFAVTLYQPWASLIALGVKQHETRGWRPCAAAHGATIAIHAGKRRVFPDLEEIPLLSGQVENLIHADHLPAGEVVATARLASSFRVQSWVQHGDGGYAARATQVSGEPVEPWPRIDVYGDWTVGRWIWVLRDVAVLVDPLPARGEQGLWRVRQDLADRIAAAAKRPAEVEP